MAIQVAANKLLSRAARLKSASDGIRKFNFRGNGSDKDKDGNIVARFFSSFIKFTSNLLGEVFKKIASVVSFSFSALWSVIVETTQFIWNFDWNISDEDLNKSVEAQYRTMVASLGSTTGQAMGWLVCGAIPGTLVFVFNEPLGLHLLDKVGLEAFDDLSSSIAGLATTTFKAYTTAAFLSIYRDARTLIRGTELDFVDTQLDKGATLAELKAQLEVRRRPFVFARKFEKVINKMPDSLMKVFIENFLDEFGETCIEAGYVVAGGIDSFYAQQQQSKDVLLGTEQTIELEFKDDGTVGSRHIV